MARWGLHFIWNWEAQAFRKENQRALKARPWCEPAPSLTPGGWCGVVCAWRGTEVSPSSGVRWAPLLTLRPWDGYVPSADTAGMGTHNGTLGTGKTNTPETALALCGGSGIFTVSLHGGHCCQWDVDL